MYPEKPKQSQKKQESVPKIKEDLKREVEVNQKMVELDIKTKLSKNNVQRFLVNHSADRYVNYKEWNINFCKSVLGLKKVSKSEQKLRVKALQKFLNKEVGGFTNELNRIDSIDGMFGTHTLGRLKAYFKKIASPTPVTKTESRESIVESKKKFRPGNTYYVGDSYMAGILDGKGVNKTNKQIASSSHLVRTRRFNTNKYRRNHVFIEDEAMKFINNPTCKLLVLNGGINDLYARGASEKTAKEIMDSYKRIIDAAHAKGIKVSIYTINTRRPIRSQSEQMKKSIARANKLTSKINDWITKESGADYVTNTDDVLNGRLSKKDGLHATMSAYRDLYKANVQKTQVGYS